MLNKHRQFTNIIIFSDHRLVIILYFYVTIPAHAGTCGINFPIITFSFKPRSGSTLPLIAASVKFLVVSWKDAADKKESLPMML